MVIKMKELCVKKDLSSSFPNTQAKIEGLDFHIFYFYVLLI